MKTKSETRPNGKIIPFPAATVSRNAQKDSNFALLKAYFEAYCCRYGAEATMEHLDATVGAEIRRRQFLEGTGESGPQAHY